MSKHIVILCVIILFLSMLPQNAAIAQSRTKLPNDFGIELLGKSFVYTFSYQHMLGNALGLQAGLSALGGGSSDDNVTVIFIPVGAKFYPIPKDGSPFLTGGLVLLTGTYDWQDTESTTYFYAGLGFEYRSNSGFLFRGTAYGLIIDGGFFIWPGLHVGYAF